MQAPTRACSRSWRGRLARVLPNGEHGRPTRGLDRRSARAGVAALCAASLAVHLWGVRRDLPLVIELDEHAVVQPAVRVAAGDWHPGTFLYPASTVIYPLAAAYRVWNGAAHQGPWLGADPSIARRFHEQPGTFYLLGRLLAVAYAVAALPLVFALGRNVFDASVGLVAAWFALLSALAVSHAQIGRTDSVGMFFVALSLWLCCRLCDRPTLGRSLLAGASVGLGGASRYFLAPLVPVLLAAQVAGLWRRRPVALGAGLWIVAAGLVAVPAAFLAATPFFLLDLAMVRRDALIQAKGAHLGADGLSFTGNLLYYAREGVPLLMSTPLALLAGAGALLALRRREPKAALLVLAIALWLVAVSASALHWARWLIPVLPVLSVLAAAPLISLGRRIPGRVLRPALVAMGLGAVSAAPLHGLVRQGVQLSAPSTRILARDWMLANLPPGATIAQEWYTAPLAGTAFVVSESRSLARGRTLGWYRDAGVRFLATSDSIAGRYLEEPERYPREAEFYRALAREGRLLQEVSPTPTRGGPRIRIYELPPHPR